MNIQAKDVEWPMINQFWSFIFMNRIDFKKIPGDYGGTFKRVDDPAASAGLINASWLEKAVKNRTSHLNAFEFICWLRILLIKFPILFNIVKRPNLAPLYCFSISILSSIFVLLLCVIVN